MIQKKHRFKLLRRDHLDLEAAHSDSREVGPHPHRPHTLFEQRPLRPRSTQIDQHDRTTILMEFLFYAGISETFITIPVPPRCHLCSICSLSDGNIVRAKLRREMGERLPGLLLEHSGCLGAIVLLPALRAGLFYHVRLEAQQISGIRASWRRLLVANRSAGCGLPAAGDYTVRRWTVVHLEPCDEMVAMGQTVGLQSLPRRCTPVLPGRSPWARNPRSRRRNSPGS